ncbi:hypothetical protein A5656_14260 [Mycobacterium gordonae]|jgi:anti-anti-sigma factor|uniref:Anti-sigma factor antagonist n=2 Tax=Mycobacteriaceae TaxID=1762 RepID=A0A1A3KTD4_MYCAS|nr:MULTISPECIES: anti-sigma factor antagonist [Mycobacterium]OBJ87206.1 hypothetical protein A5640_08015 [Mycobacterium asiaticum]OBK59551.1 hypothetical protein A5656_14260 [Mycobacterium gordonae]
MNAGDSMLRAITKRTGSAVLLSVSGEIDASNVRIWRQLVREAARAAAAPGPLVIDINGLDFMAVCAFRVLVEAAEHCRGEGIELRLVSSQPIVARIIAAARLKAELPLYPHVKAALHEHLCTGAAEPSAKGPTSPAPRSRWPHW